MKVRDALLQRLSSAVKQLQHLQVDKEQQIVNGEVASLVDEPLTECCSDLQRVCMCLDSIFLHGQRYTDQGYWAFVREFTHKDVVKELCHLHHVNTDVGRGRAWLYRALHEGLLESYLSSIIGASRRMLARHYHKEALLCDTASVEVALMTLAGLENVSIAVSWDLPFLDVSACEVALKLRADSEKLEVSSNSSSVSIRSASRTSVSSHLGEEAAAEISEQRSRDYQDSSVITEIFDNNIEDDFGDDEVLVSRPTKKPKKKRRGLSNSSNNNEDMRRNTFNTYYSLAGVELDDSLVMGSMTSNQSDLNAIVGVPISSTDSLSQSPETEYEKTVTVDSSVITDEVVDSSTQSVEEVKTVETASMTDPAPEQQMVTEEEEDDHSDFDLKHFVVSNIPVEEEKAVDFYADNQQQSDVYTDIYSDEYEQHSQPFNILTNGFAPVEPRVKTSSVMQDSGDGWFEDTNDFPEDDAMLLELDIDNSTKLELLLNVFSSDSESLLGMFRVLTAAKPLSHTPRRWCLRHRSVLLAVTTKYLHLLSRCPDSEKFTRELSVPVNGLDHVVIGLRSLSIYIHGPTSTQKCHLLIGEPRLTENLAAHLSQLLHGSIPIFRDATYQKLAIRKWLTAETTTRLASISSEISVSSDVEVARREWDHVSVVGWETDLVARIGSGNKGWGKTHNTELTGILSWRAYETRSGRRGSMVEKAASALADRFYPSQAVSPSIWDTGFFRLRGRVLTRYALDLVAAEPSEVEQRWLLAPETCVGCRFLRDNREDAGGSPVMEVRMICGERLLLSGKNIDGWLVACCNAVAEDTTSVDRSQLPQPLFTALLTPDWLLLGAESLEECSLVTTAATKLSEIASIGADASQGNYLKLEFFESDVDPAWLLYFASVAERNQFGLALRTAWNHVMKVPLKVTQIASQSQSTAYRLAAKSCERVFRQVL